MAGTQLVASISATPGAGAGLSREALNVPHRAVFPCSDTTAWDVLNALSVGLGRSHIARAPGSRQPKELLTAFLVNDAGADPFEADAEPWARPSAWAIKMGHQDIVALLNEHGY